MKKAFIFDLDGVIVNTSNYHYIAWKELAKELGFNFEEKYNSQIKGVSREKSLEVVLKAGNITNVSNEQKKILATKKNKIYLDQIENINEKNILPGINSFLEKIRSEGYKVALGSASKSGKMIIEKLKLETFFDAVVDGNTVSSAKPNPEVFLKAAEILDINPKNCIVVEDSIAGIEAAKNAGMKSIGIGSLDELFEANIVVSDTIELVELEYSKLL